jgi:formylglycine-generating enzyme required for sulfatase activity
MDHIVHRILRFDRFALDLARGCLRAGDREIDLRPKTFEVLYYLAGNAGRLVSKQEFFEAVWPSVSVCDDSLVQCIRELRQKLGDDDRRLIKTVSRRGYLLDAAVSAQALQSLSDGSAMTLAEGPRKPAIRLDVLHRALRTIPTDKLRMWGTAAVGLTCVALGIIYLLGPPLLVANPGHVSLAENVAAEPHPGPTFKDCADCPEMVALQAGQFMTGPPVLDRGVSSGLPQHVVIKKPMAIGKFEVTVDQFSTFVAETQTEAGAKCRAIVGVNGSSAYPFVLGPPEASFRSPGFPVTGNHPAVCINWHDAQAYVAWLKGRTGKPYRLPTEAEWEYAARAGTRTWYSFGNDVTELCAHGRFADLNSPFPWRDGCSNQVAGPIPVGQLTPNPWGIFDMHGNAWEWVEDCWTPNVPDTPADASAVSPPGICVFRVARGGSWANKPWELGSAVRRSFRAAFRGNQIGFRVALSLGD